MSLQVEHLPTQIAMDDLANTVIAIESLGNDVDKNNNAVTPTLDPCTSSGEAKPKVTAPIILFADGAYHLYFEAWSLFENGWGDPTVYKGFLEWLAGLTKDDTIYFHQTCPYWRIYSAMPTLVAIDVCLAKKVFVFDIFMDYGSFALVCDEFKILDTGGIVFRRLISADHDNFQEACDGYHRELFNRAVKHKFLTPEEVDQILNDDKIICLTAKDLRTRLGA